MLGVAILVGIAVYIGIAWLVVRAVKGAWAKAAAIIVALAIPLWDLPIGYAAYSKHCRDEGGLYQLAAITPSSGIFFSYPPGLRPQYMFAKGADVVEYAMPDGSILRYSKSASGAPDRAKTDKPSSAARLNATFNAELPWNVFKDEIVLVDASARPLARATSFYWIGGWISRLTAPLLVPEENCHASALDDILALAIKGSGK